MIRSFLPVGQGAFYVEQFKCGVNIVYDCGSSTGVNYVNDMIKATFSEGERISIVFISHMHSDHINGLEFLIKHCRVEKIYIPYLYPDEIHMSKCVQLITKPNESEFVHEFIEKPEQAVERLCGKLDVKIPRVFRVLPGEDEFSNTEGISNDNEVSYKYHYSGEPIKIDFANYASREWTYIPYNLKNKERKNRFETELNLIGVAISDNNAIFSLLKTKVGRKKLKEVYKKVEGGLNTNSLVIYSGPPLFHSKGWQRRIDNYECDYVCCCRTYFKNGCLYLGDFDARNNWGCVEAKYADYWENIGVIQLPHHGSQYNYNSKIISNNAFLIISAGFNNPYKHPHVKVLKELIRNNKRFAWVTEEIGSMIQFDVCK